MGRISLFIFALALTLAGCGTWLRSGDPVATSTGAPIRTTTPPTNVSAIVTHTPTIAAPTTLSGLLPIRAKALDFAQGSSFALSADGKLIALNYTETIEAYDISAGRLTMEYKKPSAGLMGGGAIAFSPVGSLVAASVNVDSAESEGGIRSDIYLLDALTGERKRVIEFAHPAVDLDFSTDGALLAATYPGRYIQVWESNGQWSSTLDAGATDIEFAPLRSTLASAEIVTGADGGPAVRLWNPRDLTTEGLFPLAPSPDGYYSGEATSVSFSPDGGVLAAIVNGDLRLWDTNEDRELPVNFLSTEGPFVRAVFSARGMLAVLNQSGTIAMIEPRSAEELGALTLQATEVPDYFSLEVKMAFTPDGDYLVVGGSGRPIEFWKFQ